MPPVRQLLITCEHGGNRIPPRYADLFRGQAALLASHRGYDPGARSLGREMARTLEAPFILATTSRLLVDLNRSPGHPRLYSGAVRQAPAEVRREIFARYYLPHRHRVEAFVAETAAQRRPLLHIACHSFTPVLDGALRNADIGLLYDPRRPGEAALCRAWQQALKTLAPGLRVRLNYPYTGKSDGFSTWLRRRFPPESYVGIELEINQEQVRHRAAWRRLRRVVIAALRQALPPPGSALGSPPGEPPGEPICPPGPPSPPVAGRPRGNL